MAFVFQKQYPAEIEARMRDFYGLTPTPAACDWRHIKERIAWRKQSASGIHCLDSE